jgi:hypothetical protein
VWRLWLGILKGELIMNPELAQVLRDLEESTARMISALTKPILLESKLEAVVNGGNVVAVVDGPELSQL